jgi:hypothetical protein
MPPSSGNPNAVPALPMGFPFDTVYNTTPPGAFLADVSTIGNTGHLFTAPNHPSLLGYAPYPQTCFSDWTLQNVSAATISPIVPSQNMFPELRPEFIQDLLPLTAETYPEHLEELSNHRWGQVSRSIPSQELHVRTRLIRCSYNRSTIYDVLEYMTFEDDRLPNPRHNLYKVKLNTVLSGATKS